MTNETMQVKETKRTSPFRYGIGMLGTSIPINMFFCLSTRSWT